VGVDSHAGQVKIPVGNALDGYSRLSHLVGALLGIHDPRRTVVAPVVTFYGDASGAPDQGLVLVVAGFISFESRWKSLEKEWKQALANEKVEYFHMGELINGKPPYRGWNQRRKKRLVDKLAAIVARNVVKSFASYVVLDDWNKANQQYQFAECDYYPYAIAGWSCVDRVLQWCEETVYNDPPPIFVFEHGDKHQDSLRRCVEKNLGVIIQTGLKTAQKKKPHEKPITELQSGDFAAWQCLNLMRENQMYGAPQLTLEPWLWEAFNRLFSSVKYDHNYFSLQQSPIVTHDRRLLQVFRAPSLIRFARDRKIPPRI
jgi:hypothetical protein